LAAKLEEFSVTTGNTVATCTADPLPTPSVVTITVNVPAVGDEVSVMVNEVAVTAVTVPTPDDNVTMLLPFGSNPAPSMINLLALAANVEEFSATTG